MGSFLIGLCAALVIAVAVGFGLNALEISSAELFSTNEVWL